MKIYWLYFKSIKKICISLSLLLLLLIGIIKKCSTLLVSRFWLFILSQGIFSCFWCACWCWCWCDVTYSNLTFFGVSQQRSLSSSRRCRSWEMTESCPCQRARRNTPHPIRAAPAVYSTCHASSNSLSVLAQQLFFVVFVFLCCYFNC